MNSTTYSVVVTGLGGQGVLMVSKVLAAAAWRSYPHVFRTESRGLSQRGGSVSTVVRFGNRRLTPVVGVQAADALLSLDLLESARSLPCLKSDGVLVSNDQYTLPLSLLMKWKNADERDGERERLTAHLHGVCGQNTQIQYVNLIELAEQAQFPKGLNSVLLGAASVFVPIPVEDLREETMLAVKPQFREANELAFDLGRAAGAGSLFNRNVGAREHLASA